MKRGKEDEKDIKEKRQTKKGKNGVREENALKREEEKMEEKEEQRLKRKEEEELNE